MLPYNAEHSIQQTEQIHDDPPRMGAKSTTTRNHPSTPIDVILEYQTFMSYMPPNIYVLCQGSFFKI